MSFQKNVPLASDKLRVSQSDLNSNFQALDSSFDVDHVTYSDGTGNAGKHTKVTITDVDAPAGQTDPQSIIYTEAGIESTKVTAKFKNEDGVFPLSGIKAFGAWTTRLTVGACTIVNSSNVDSVSVTSFDAGLDVINYNVTLTPNAIASKNVIVIIQANDYNGSVINAAGQVYEIVGNIIRVVGAYVNNATMSILVLQA